MCLDGIVLCVRAKSDRKMLRVERSSVDLPDGDETQIVYRPNTSKFSGKVKIHFAVQSSEDGTHWETQMAGEEERKK